VPTIESTGSTEKEPAMTLEWLLGNFTWMITLAGAIYILWIFYRRGAEERKQRDQ
jgi:hypothetical protein